MLLIDGRAFVWGAVGWPNHSSDLEISS
eukprot:COSAG02_NODE_47111_length_343_cov_1.262295_1_plen_27_part_01